MTMFDINCKLWNLNKVKTSKKIMKNFPEKNGVDEAEDGRN